MQTSDLMSRTAVKTAALTLFLCGAVGCYNHQLQLKEPVTPPRILATPQEHYADLGVIELDDMGELRNRCGLSDTDKQPCQMNDTLNWIRAERLAALKAGEQSVVVTFVHGWRHNADSRDENLQRFSIAVYDLQDAANKLAENCTSGVKRQFVVDGLTVSCQATAARRLRYIGVYVGWRGKSVVDIPPISYSSLLNRESGAKRVAAVSSTEVFYRIRDAAKQQLCSANDGQCSQIPEGQFIIAGHSFGGLIVERTLAQALTAQIVGGSTATHSQPCATSNSGYQSFADLVVLINPAIEALETQQLIDMMKRSRFHTCPQQAESVAPPLLVSIKAQNDLATGVGFTIAHFVESLDKTFRTYNEEPALSATADPHVPTQRSVFESTVGSINYFHNYCYIESPYRNTGDQVCDRIAKSRCEDLMDQASKSQVHLDQVARKKRGQSVQAYSMEVPMASKGGSACDSTAPTIGNLFTRYDPVKCAQGRCDVWNDTPYWIFTVPKTVINRHGGFWNPSFEALLLGIVQQTTERPTAQSFSYAR